MEGFANDWPASQVAVASLFRKALLESEVAPFSGSMLAQKSQVGIAEGQWSTCR